MVSCSFLIFALVLSVITANAAEKKFELRLEPGTNPNADPQMASYNIAKVNLKSEFDKLTNGTGLVEFGQHVKTAFKSETLKAGVREQTRNRVNDPITIITGSPFQAARNGVDPKHVMVNTGRNVTLWLLDPNNRDINSVTFLVAAKESMTIYYCEQLDRENVIAPYCFDDDSVTVAELVRLTNYNAAPLVNPFGGPVAEGYTYFRITTLFDANKYNSIKFEAARSLDPSYFIPQFIGVSSNVNWLFDAALKQAPEKVTYDAIKSVNLDISTLTESNSGKTLTFPNSVLTPIQATTCQFTSGVAIQTPNSELPFGKADALRKQLNLLRNEPVIFSFTNSANQIYFLSFLIASKDGNVEVTITKGEQEVKADDKLKLALVAPEGAGYKNPFASEDGHFNNYKYYLMTLKLPVGSNGVTFKSMEATTSAIIPLRIGKGNVNENDENQNKEKENDDQNQNKEKENDDQNQNKREETEDENPKRNNDKEENGGNKGPVKEKEIKRDEAKEDFSSPMITTASVGLLALSLLAAE